MIFKSREQVNMKLTGVLAALVDNEAVAKEIAFHITDWKENLVDLVEIYDLEERLSNEQIEQIIIRFLAHVPNHVAAAKKLIGLGPVEDVFDVGATRE